MTRQRARHWTEDKRLALAAERCLSVLLDDFGVRRTRLFLDRTVTVKATRHNRPRKGQRQEVFIVTMGRPNYAEREVIRRKGAPNGVLKYPFPEKRNAT